MNSLVSLLQRSGRALGLTLGIAIFVIFSLQPAQAQNTFEGRVSKVLDGDSFTIRGESRRIRVWGLDAPEWNHRGGQTAKNMLRQLIGGQTLTCAVRDVDRYGRLVAQCVLPNGADIAAAMINSGTASEYCRYSRGYYGTC